LFKNHGFNLISNQSGITIWNIKIIDKIENQILYPEWIEIV